MKKAKAIHFISWGGILTAFTVILQSAPIYLPTIGLVLSPISSLPVALAAVINIYLGLMVLISSALLLLLVSVQEMMIFIFATGLIGLMLGIFIFRRSLWTSVAASVVSLMIGLMILTYIVAIPGFVSFTATLSFVTIIMIYFIFCFFYICIWAICLRRFTHRILYVILKTY